MGSLVYRSTLRSAEEVLVNPSRRPQVKQSLTETGIKSTWTGSWGSIPLTLISVCLFIFRMLAAKII